MHLRARMPIAALLLVATGCAEESAPVDADPPASTPAPSGSAAPSTRELTWKPTEHDPGQRVIVGARWTALASESEVVFEGRGEDGGERIAIPVDEAGTVDAVLLEGDTAVISAGFGGETTAGWGVRVDLTTGQATEVVSPEPANGGDWALVDDSLYYPTLGEGDTLCLATLAVSDGNGEDGWCAPARTGFTNLTAGTHGVGLMSFDAARPVSCRTLHLLDDTATPSPVEGPSDCKGWDVTATDTGIVWSEVPDERRQEVGRFEALADGSQQELGRGTTGSLTPCGGDAFFVRDPASPQDPARLMRWDGSALTVAWQSSSRGNVFLGDPECADGILTVTAFGEDGDQQVWASVG
ncbi:hypothetical protein [Nocardioides piscis]|uniref:Uncharacterized protein n=1 Tax=Nocardioides piscis TaxID=2714938 RepID=A0A6G7YE45_9ACTN|nr:hypothetical protein [Nocardioides piscis]QIK75092.1 hypothetical protein G7071_06265 [Nocardioides piscis]